MRSSIPQEDVFSAIESLLKSGKTPNFLNVRTELGGSGSGPELSRMISAWYAQFGPAYAAASSPETHRSVVETACDELAAALDISALRIEEGPTAAFCTVFERIGLTLSQLVAVLQAWESDLMRREAELVERERNF